MHELAAHDVPMFGPEQVKGLEFDGVVVVERRTRSSTARSRGARLLYVAMTRAVQELAFVTTRPDLVTLLLDSENVGDQIAGGA